jgi:TolA-binding protein
VRLLKFKQYYPDHPYADPALFLLGDLYYAKGIPDNFQNAVDAWRSAIDNYHNSFEAPRAALMLGEANLKMGYYNEAAGLYKLASESFPNSPYGPLAILRAADTKLAMGLIDEARELVKPLAEKKPKDPFSTLALLRLAMADYLDTLYSQSTEKFREALDIDSQIYDFYPEMLYALGDSYSYLNRPDLTVLFLEHALNVTPDHPKSDVMFARIGNAYQAMDRPQEAISFFKVAKNEYPNKDGGLVSQIRLADMGALRAFFQGDQVFDALERGARQATVKMYEQIINESSTSPLLQLAYLKIGQAQAADGENSEAIRWLRDLVNNFPKGILFEEARPILSRALVNEATERFTLGDYQKIRDLYFDNSSFLEGLDRIRFLRLLAQSNENLGLHNEALEVWQMIERESPDRRLNDQKEVITAALLADRPLDAFNQIKATAVEFPSENDWLYQKLYETILSFAKPKDAKAVNDLINILNDPAIVPLEEISQLALSEAISILVQLKNYNAAMTLMDSYQEKYPDDELSPEYLLTQAKISERLKNYDDSWNRLSNFRIAYPDDPRVPQTILDTIKSARAHNRLPDAWRYEELYRQLYPTDPQGRKLMLARAEEEWENGFNNRALNTLNTFQREYPNDPATPATFLNEYQKLYDSGNPTAAFAALRELRNRYPQDPLTIQSYFTEYRDAIKAKMPETAFNIFNQFRTKFPTDPRIPDFLLEKAKDHFAFNQKKEGLDSWEDFIASYPNDSRVPELTLLIARQELKDNLTQNALARYRQYLNKYPSDPSRNQVLLEVAAIEGSLNINDAAYNDLETFRREFPGSKEEPQVLLDQIRYATQLRRFNEAVTLYDVFRKGYPEHSQFRQSFLDETRMLMTAGQNSKALGILEDGIVQSPGIDNDPATQELLLSLYLNEGRIEDWAGATEEYLRRDPNPQSHLAERFNKFSQVAQVYQELGRQNDAQRNYDLAMQNKPPDASGEALYAIAGGYKKMGLTDSYRGVLEVMLNLPDPLWQRVANQELGQG